MENFILFSIMAVFFYSFMILTLLAGKRNRVVNSFMAVLLMMLCWTLGSLLMRSQIKPGYIFWYHVSLAGILFLPYSYYLFICKFMGVQFRKRSWLYFLLMFVLLIVNVLTGRIVKWPEVVTTKNNIRFVYHMTPWALLFFVAAGVTILHIAFVIWQGCRKNPGYLNQIKPLVIGMAILFAGNIAVGAPVFEGFPIDILSGVINAILMLYALIRNRLFQMRRLASNITCYCVGAILTLLLFLSLSQTLNTYIDMLFPGYEEYHTLIFSSVFFVSICLIAALWKGLVNNIFIKKEVHQSQELKDFSQAISKTLHINDIMRSTVNVIKETTHAKSIYICLKNEKCGDYDAIYSDQPLNDMTFSLRADNPMISYLKKDNDYIIISDFHSTTAYKSLWESEKQMISRFNIECCYSLTQNGELIGIIIIGNDGHKALNFSDITMISSISSVASIAINNARLYESALRDARTDELTQVLNHKYFYEVLNDEFEKNKDGSIALILINIDDFKLYNQLYGNHQGDIALKQTADIIRASVGERGYVARNSAKEFAVLMPNYDIFSAKNLAESIRKQILNMRNDSADYKLKILTVSIGISAAPYTAHSPKELVGNADLAVYHVKQNGKNAIAVYDTLLRESIDEENALQKSNHKNIYQSYETTIYALTAAIDAKDHYTFSHSNNVAYYSVELAKALNYSHEMVEIIRQAALLHDIGKISIPEHILNKPGKLTAEEYEIIQGHVEASIGIIRHLPSLDYVIPAVIGHHERYDGRGYPRRIAGEDIPASARILCIADSFDAMTAKRCYKSVMPVEKALDIIRAEEGGQFDPQMAEVFIKCFREGRIKLVDSTESTSNID